MTLKIDRRTLLQGLIAIGAAYVLPVKATKAQVEKIWEEALSEPWFFEVDDNGTLVHADVPEPQVWADVFDITTSETSDAEDLIREVQACPPLASYMDRALIAEIESLEEDLDCDTAESSKEQKALRKKIEALKEFRDEYDEAWQGWVELEGKNGISKFNSLIEDWLTDPIDWMQSEWFPVRSGPQGAALGFFQDQSYDLLDAVGVTIVDGEHPGSSYFAAELTQGVNEANAAAEKLNLPFRFKCKTKVEPKHDVVMVPQWQPSKLAIAINGVDDQDGLLKIDTELSEMSKEDRNAALSSELNHVIDKFISTLPPATSLAGSMGKGMKSMKLREHVRGFVRVCGRAPNEDEIRRLWDAT